MLGRKGGLCASGEKSLWLSYWLCRVGVSATAVDSIRKAAIPTARRATTIAIVAHGLHLRRCPAKGSRLRNLPHNNAQLGLFAIVRKHALLVPHLCGVAILAMANT